MRLDEARERIGLQERHIGVQEQQRAATALQRLLRLHERVSGAELRRLDDELQRRPMLERRLHVVGAVAHDERRRRG